MHDSNCGTLDYVSAKPKDKQSRFDAVSLGLISLICILIPAISLLFGIGAAFVIGLLVCPPVGFAAGVYGLRADRAHRSDIALPALGLVLNSTALVIVAMGVYAIFIHGIC